MHAAVRRYRGASALMDEMERRRDDVEKIMKEVPGFSAYYAVRSGDSLTAITVCEDRAGAEASTRRASAWVKENLPSVRLAPPEVAGGEVFLAFRG